MQLDTRMTRRGFGAAMAGASLVPAATPGLKKIKDITIYSNGLYYCAFPSIIRRRDGELIAAFRRAPERPLLGEKGHQHTDPNAYLVLVRSRDNGETWTKEPELIYAHPFGGSQDPCIVQLRDGSIVCTSYLWVWLNRQQGAKTKATAELGQYAFQGGYIMRSGDGAHTWKGPFYPPAVPNQAALDVFGKPLPAYNRGAPYQGRDGRLYWAVAYGSGGDRTAIHLMISADRGETWKYSCPIASDSKVTFNETSMYGTPKGDLLAFVRTAGFDDHAVIVRSRDGGKSFEPWQDMGWQGHPLHAVRLEDNRVFLVYGYRHQPFGIRARVLNPECTDFASAPEFILRDDGSNTDLGYPWAVTLPGRRILVAYYFHSGGQYGGNRFIAGTLLSY